VCLCYFLQFRLPLPDSPAHKLVELCMKWKNCNNCKMSWIWEELKYLQDLCAKLRQPLVLRMALASLWIKYYKIICYKDIECWCVARWQWHQGETTDILQNWSWIEWFSWPGLCVSDCLLLSLVEVITGINLTVRPTKIIAGHEPTKTNELLQAIGTALDRKVRAKRSTRSFMSALITHIQ
jgi:hypothetical protein